MRDVTDSAESAQQVVVGTETQIIWLQGHTAASTCHSPGARTSLFCLLLPGNQSASFQLAFTFFFTLGSSCNVLSLSPDLQLLDYVFSTFYIYICTGFHAKEVLYPSMNQSINQFTRAELGEQVMGNPSG